MKIKLNGGKYRWQVLILDIVVLGMFNFMLIYGLKNR